MVDAPEVVANGIQPILTSQVVLEPQIGFAEVMQPPGIPRPVARVPRCSKLAGARGRGVQVFGQRMPLAGRGVVFGVRVHSFLPQSERNTGGFQTATAPPTVAGTAHHCRQLVTGNHPIAFVAPPLCLSDIVVIITISGKARSRVGAAGTDTLTRELQTWSGEVTLPLVAADADELSGGSVRIPPTSGCSPAQAR